MGPSIRSGTSMGGNRQCWRPTGTPRCAALSRSATAQRFERDPTNGRLQQLTPDDCARRSTAAHPLPAKAPTDHAVRNRSRADTDGLKMAVMHAGPQRSGNEESSGARVIGNDAA